jgi:tRNA(adenine34) deaminase
MQAAFKLARAAARQGEVPIGAVLLKGNRVIAQAFNLTRTHHDPTAHAEMIAIHKAAKILENERLLETVLYVTLEPCAMCAGAIVQARIPTVVFGARDPKAGAAGSVFNVLSKKKLNHRPAVIKDVMAAECGQLLRDFFRRKR